MHDPLSPPDQEETWVGMSGGPLPVDVAARWAVRPDCGALTLFSGTARDHAPGRPGVYRLEYEAYDDYVVPVLRSVADEARRRWPDLGRIVLLHRTGEVAIGDSAVVVAVSAPHRASAFEAARFCIDTVKRTAPIWKRELWAGGESWGRCDHDGADAHELADGRDAGEARGAGRTDGAAAHELADGRDAGEARGAGRIDGAEGSGGQVQSEAAQP